MRRLVSVLATVVLTLAGLAGTAGARPGAQRHHSFGITRDAQGVVHITAPSLERAYYLNGWVHARDRLFQMDVTRRSASGTLAELLGKPALEADIQARTIGLRRAAERTWAAGSAGPAHDPEGLRRRCQ